MPRRSSSDLSVVDAITYAQRGLITSAQLLEAGISRSTTQHRIRTGGVWQRVLPGTYLVQTGPPDLMQRRHAAQLYAGPTAVITGAHALHLLDVGPEPPAGAPIDVLLPHVHARRDAAFVRIERTRRDPRAREVGNLRVASPARAAVDAARRLTSRSAVDALLARTVQSEAVTVPELVVEYRSAHRRTTALVKDAIESLAAGTRSAPEAELRRLWPGSGLPEPRWNPELWLPDGTYISSPDAYVADVALAVEVESKEFHFGADEWYGTLARQARVMAHGVVFFQVAPQRLYLEGEQVMAEIRSTVDSLTGRPLPRIDVRRRRTG